MAPVWKQAVKDDLVRCVVQHGDLHGASDRRPLGTVRAGHWPAVHTAMQSLGHDITLDALNSQWSKIARYKLGPLLARENFHPQIDRGQIALYLAGLAPNRPELAMAPVPPQQPAAASGLAVQRPANQDPADQGSAIQSVLVVAASAHAQPVAPVMAPVPAPQPAAPFGPVVHGSGPVAAHPNHQAAPPAHALPAAAPAPDPAAPEYAQVPPHVIDPALASPADDELQPLATMPLRVLIEEAQLHFGRGLHLDREVNALLAAAALRLQQQQDMWGVNRLDQAMDLFNDLFHYRDDGYGDDKQEDD